MNYALFKTVTKPQKKSFFSFPDKIREYSICDASHSPLITWIDTPGDDDSEMQSATTAPAVKPADKLGRLTADAKEYRVIRAREGWYKPWYYVVMDDRNHEVARIDWNSHGVPYSLFGKSKRPNAIIQIKYTSYEFWRLKPAVKWKLFDSSTWGYYQYAILTPEGRSLVEFSFRPDRYNSGASTSDRDFAGEAVNKNNDPLLAALGLFLIDLEIKQEVAAQNSSG